MSGIAGIIRLDGAPAAGGDVDRMLLAMARRGPDRRQSLSAGTTTFGQALLATTPEALAELQPWINQSSGAIVVSDSRLDNRPELLRSLGIERAVDQVGDGELLHAAYERWGTECAARLLGDFAFAIWDPSLQQLFCARDVMGVRPLYFHHSPGVLFAFASSAEALLEVAQIPRQFDEGRIADVLMGDTAGGDREGHDRTSSFFSAISRLPSAHHLLMDAAGIRQWRYWRPSDAPPFGGHLSKVTEEEWIDGLREHLQRAVHRRMRSHGRVGSMLSGGLDSSAVVALASQHLQAAGHSTLPTYSATSQQPGCPETAAIATMLAHFPLQSTRVDWEACDHLIDEATPDWARQGEPWDVTLTIVDFQYRNAARQGVRCIMDGIDADRLLSEEDYLQGLVARGQFRRAIYESRQSARFFGDRFSLTDFLRTTVPQALAPQWMRRPWRRWRRSVAPIPAIFLPAFLQRLDVDARQQACAAANAREQQADAVAGVHTSMNSADLQAGVERYGRVAAAHGIEPRHPFLDRQLIEYCAWLPLSLRLRDGYPKWVLRQALVGVLPDQVTWRRGKEHLGWRFNFALIQRRPDLADPERLPGNCWRDYMDAAQFPTPEVGNKWRSGDGGWESAYFKSALARWLQRMTDV